MLLWGAQLAALSQWPESGLDGVTATYGLSFPMGCLLRHASTHLLSAEFG